MSEELILAEESPDYPDFNFTLCHLPELEHVIGKITTLTMVLLKSNNFVQSYRITAGKCCHWTRKEAEEVSQPT